MKKIIFVSFCALFIAGCSKDLIKDEELIISSDLSKNSSSKKEGFKTLSSYTDENYSKLEKDTFVKEDYSVIASSDPLKIESELEEKNWLKRDWPTGLAILGVIAAAAILL